MFQSVPASVRGQELLSVKEEQKCCETEKVGQELGVGAGAAQGDPGGCTGGLQSDYVAFV